MLIPTARRDFSRAETATLSTKVYQGGSGITQQVAVSARILDSGGSTVIERQVVASEPDAGRAEEVRMSPPLSALAPGSYLTQIQATLGKGD
jgi:hypothetical protein